MTTIERSRLAVIALGAVTNQPTATAPAVQEPAYEVHLTDSSVVVARKLALEKDQLLVEEPLLGNLKVAIKDVVSVSRRGK